MSRRKKLARLVVCVCVCESLQHTHTYTHTPHAAHTHTLTRSTLTHTHTHTHTHTRDTHSYYIQVILSFVCLTSAHHISQRLLPKLSFIMEHFLISPNVDAIALAEKATPWLMGWDPFPPFIRLLYPPPDTPEQKKLISRYSKSDRMLINKIHLLCAESFLIVLKVMIQHDPDLALSRLTHGGLLEYLLCLPQNVHDSLKDGAKDIVELLRTAKKAKTIPVPKLNIMVRSYFAKIHFGLKKIIDMSADDIRMELSPPPLPPNVIVQGKGDPPAYMNKDATPIYVLAL